MAALNPLRRWQRRVVDASGLLLLITGVAWWALHWGWGAGAGELPHPAEAWLMRLHGAGVLLGLYAVGLVSAQHAAAGWRMRRQRVSGSLLLTTAAALALSGYALYYWVPEDWRPPVGHAHTAVGLLIAAALVWHRRAVRQAGRRP